MRHARAEHLERISRRENTTECFAALGLAAELFWNSNGASDRKKKKNVTSGYRDNPSRLKAVSDRKTSVHRDTLPASTYCGGVVVGNRPPPHSVWFVFRRFSRYYLTTLKTPKYNSSSAAAKALRQRPIRTRVPIHHAIRARARARLKLTDTALWRFFPTCALSGRDPSREKSAFSRILSDVGIPSIFSSAATTDGSSYFFVFTDRRDFSATRFSNFFSFDWTRKNNGTRDGQLDFSRNLVFPRESTAVPSQTEYVFIYCIIYYTYQNSV